MDEPSAICADPQRTILGDSERGNILAGERGCIFGVEAGESDAVEARQTDTSADPEIAVGSLGDGTNEIVRQAFISLPGATGVF